MNPTQNQNSENSQEVTKNYSSPVGVSQPTTPPSEIPSDPQPQESVLKPQPTQPAAPASKPLGKILAFFFFLLFILLTVGVLGATYAVAYEKIKLDKYPDFQMAVSQAVISLPFMPKTPKFLIARSTFTHQKVTKQSFDLSMALDSSYLYSALGVNKLDLEAKGAIDYSEPKDPKITLTASLTKDFNLDFRKNDPVLYFKINKIPVTLLNLVGVDASAFDPVLEKWVSYDTTPLDTEARRNIDEEVNPLSDKFVDKIFSDYIDDTILSKMKLEKVTEEGISLYKITLDADSELINYIGRKLDKNLYALDNPNTPTLSDTVKSLHWEFFIDDREYYTRKMVMSGNLEFDDAYLGELSMTTPSLTGNSSINFAFATKFGNFGEEVEIVTPEESMSAEEFSKLLRQSLAPSYPAELEVSEDTPSYRDAKRVTDLQILRVSLEQFKADCEIYPENLTALLESDETACTSSGPYLVFVPKDPQDFSSYYYQMDSDKTSYDLCAKLETEGSYPLNVTCPDSYFNYHITNP